MAAQSFKLDTSFQSEQYKTREPIEKTDMTKYTSILGSIDEIMDENADIMKKYETSHDEVEKKLSIIKRRVSVGDVINNNNMILEISQNRNNNLVAAADAADENRRVTDKQKNLIKKINIIDFTAIERRKNKYEYRLYQRYLKNLNRIEIEEIEKQKVEYMTKMFNKFTIIKVTGSIVAIGISLLLITSITNPLVWIQIGETMVGSPFTINLFTDIFWNFGIFNIADVSNLKNLFEMFLADKGTNELLKNAEYIKALLTLIFTPLTTDSVESLDVLFPFLNLKAFVVGKKLSEIKTRDILELLKKNTDFISHSSDNTVSKLFLTIQTIINKKNIFDPKQKISLDTNWFEFVTNLYSSPQFNFFLSSCKLCYNVYGYVNTQIDTLQSAPNIDSTILFKGIAEGALNSMSFSVYTNLISTNFLKHIIGNRLDEVFISTILGDFNGVDINGFFVTTLGSLIQIQSSSIIKGYFKKIETEVGYITMEERVKRRLEAKKDPVVETELLIRKFGKKAGEGLTNEQILQSIYPEEYKTEADYKFFATRHLKTFFTTFKQFLSDPACLLYSLANVSVIYNALVNTFYTGLFGTSVYSFQRMILTGWGEYGINFYTFKFSILEFITFILPNILGSDQAIIYNITKLRTQMISDIMEDIQTLTIKLQNIFFDSRAGMSINKYLRKVNDTILGSLFSTSCKVIYNIILLPQLQIKLNDTIPQFKFELSKFLNDPDKVYKFFSFTNHRMSNLYNMYYTTSKFTLQDVWNEMKKFTNIQSFINENFLPYIAANNIYNYDELNVSNMKGNVIHILNEEGLKAYGKNIDRVPDEKYVDKSYVVVHKDLNDNYQVIDYSIITSGLADQIKQNIVDPKYDQLKKTPSEDLFYMYYYTKFMESNGPSYTFILDDFKKYMLKLQQDVRKNNNSSDDEIGVEYGVINNVILSINKRFNDNNILRSFGKDMGLPINIVYDGKNFNKLDAVFQAEIQAFLSIENTKTLPKISFTKNDITADNVILSIFTPNTYGYLPQSLKGVDFYSFREIIQSINRDDLTSDPMKKLAELELLAENDYSLKSDLAMLNNNFKLPFRQILQNTNNLDTGFIKDFSDPKINLPIKDLGFDYKLFKQKIEKIIKQDFPLLNQDYLRDPIVAEYLVTLLGIKDVTITKTPDDYISQLEDNLFTPEMLIKLSQVTSSQIKVAQNTVTNKYKKPEVLQDYKNMETITNYLKKFTSGIQIETIVNGNSVTNTKTIFDLIYETINEQNKYDNPELGQLNLVLKTMVPKMYYDTSIKLTIENYFKNTNSPLDRENIVKKLQGDFTDLFKDIKSDIDQIEINSLKRHMKDIIDRDNFNNINLSDRAVDGGLLKIDDIKGYFTTEPEKQMMSDFLELGEQMSKLKQNLTQQINFFDENVSILNRDENPTLYEYKWKRSKWLEKSLEIYKTYRRKKADLFYREIVSNRKIIDNQIETTSSEYLKRLNTLYLKYKVSKNPGDTPKFKPQQRPQEDDQKDNTKRFPKGPGKQSTQSPLKKVDQDQLIKNQINEKVAQAQKQGLQTDEGLDEALDEGLDEEQKEKLKEETAFASDDIAESFFLFFSNMFNKLGTTNVADSDIETPPDVDVKTPDKHEKSTIDVCEQISGKWSIYDYNVRVHDTSIDIDDAKRCNELNMSQTFFEKINMSYKKSESLIQSAYTVICGLATGFIRSYPNPLYIATLATIIAISCIGSVSPQASLLVVHYVFIYTFKTYFRSVLIDKSVGRPTNFGIKILYSIWYHSFKNLTKIYTEPGSTDPDYDQMCRGYTCTLIKNIPGFSIPISYRTINDEANTLMQDMYNIASNDNISIDITKYNIFGDIDIGQKTGEINTSSLKDLIIKLSTTSFITDNMIIKYNLLVEKNTNSNLECGDILYNIENLKIAIYSYMNSLVDPTKKEFFYDFIMCSFIGGKSFNISNIFSILWHLITNPGIFIKFFRDLVIIIISNKDIRPFILSFLFGKESQGKNKNFIRDVIDAEIKYLEDISLNKSNEFDKEIFQKKLSDSMLEVSNFFIYYVDIIGKIYQAFFGDSNNNNPQAKQVKKWILYEEFISCVTDGCDELKSNAKGIINEIQTNILDISVNNFINIIDLNKINDNKYILEEINKQINQITTNSSSFKYKAGISQEDAEDYLQKYGEVLNKYKTYITRQIELENFIYTRFDSKNNPFYNFPLQNFLSANDKNAIFTDLINICEPSQMLVYTGTGCSCKEIEISHDLKLTPLKYSKMIEDKKKLLLDETFKFLTDIMTINGKIDELCNKQGLCSEPANKEEIQRFIQDSNDKLTSFNEQPEEGFTKLKKILINYKTDASKILSTFEEKLNKQISDNNELLLSRNKELENNAKTPEEIDKATNGIESLKEENEKLNSNLKIIRNTKTDVDNVKPPDDINKITDFKTYLYTTLLKSVDVNKNPGFYAYLYLSYFDINSFKIKTEDLIKVYDAFSSDTLDLEKLILSDGTTIKFTDSKFNENLNNKDVKQYIKTFVGKKILEDSAKTTKFTKDRDATLRIKKTGEQLPTKVTTGVELISSLSDKPITDIKPFNILFEYGYFLDKNQGEKSSLTLSRTWPKQHKDLGDKQNFMEDYVFKTFSGDKEGFFKYNKDSSFDEGNKITGSIPPILHGLNINKDITNTDVKAFIQKNYEKVGGLWILKPDLQLYSNTFKGFDKVEFARSIEQTILMKSELKLQYLKSQAALKDEVEKLEVEKAAAQTAVNKANRALFYSKKSEAEQAAERERLKKEEEDEAEAARLKKEQDEADRIAKEQAEAARLKKQQEEWDSLSYFERAYRTAANIAHNVKTSVTESVTENVTENVTNVTEKVTDAAILGVKGVKLFTDVVIGNVSLEDAAKKVTNKAAQVTEDATELANYYWHTTLNEKELKYFDTYIGVQFDYFNELEVNVNNPFGLNKFSDFYKKYNYGTDSINSGHVIREGWIWDGIEEYKSMLDIEERETINFIALFNEIFSPSILSKPWSNAYYDVNSEELLYNSEGIKELKNR